MNITVRTICGKYQEVTVSEMATGTLDKDEAVEQAKRFIQAADDLLWGADLERLSNHCTELLDEIDSK